MLNHVEPWQSQSGSKLLAFFCEHAGQAYYAKEIAEKTGQSSGAVNQSCRQLAESGFLTREKRGREFFYSLNSVHPPARAYMVFVRLLQLKPAIARLTGRCRKIILYGSTATGFDGPQSDVDLLVVSDDPDAEKIIRSIMQDMPRLSITLKSTSELLQLRKKDPAYYENAVLRGLLIHENV